MLRTRRNTVYSTHKEMGLKSLVFKSLGSSDDTRALVIIDFVRDVPRSGCGEQIGHDTLRSFLGCKDTISAFHTKDKAKVE